MTKRDYPLLLIDRSKHSTYPFDYIVCFDKTVGFVARIVPFFEDVPYNEFLKRSANIKDGDCTSITHKLKKGGVVVVIEDFFYYFDWTVEIKTRIKTLLKKALKKYLHAEIDRSAMNDLGIENQIKQQEANIEMAKQNYEDLIKRSVGGKKQADYIIALSEATLKTLKMVKDNQGFFNLN